MNMKSRRERVLEKKEKEFQKLMGALRDGRQVIVVEGKHDRAALKEAGIENEIELANQAPIKVAERVSKKADEAVLLMDFDRRGEEKLEMLVEALHSCNVKPDVEIRRKLKYLFGIRFFEDLDKKVAEFEQELNEIRRIRGCTSLAFPRTVKAEVLSELKR